MAHVKFDIGTSKPIIIEQWQQMKNSSGNLTDTMVRRITAYANINSPGGSRKYENFQTKDVSSFKIIVRQRALEIDCLWKVIYKGQRYTVLSKDRVDEKMFDYLLTIEVK